ncbi:hypothetical protein ACTA71_007535 [Dictyostelium dimigraforme]
MEGILNFNEPLDIKLLDQIVSVLYNPQSNKNDIKAAQIVLGKFQEHPDAWSKVDTILETSTLPQTKFIALVIMDSLIKYRWKSLPREQCEGIKNYIVSLIIRLSSDPQTSSREKLLINKLNLVFVQILKQEWTTNWSTFIPEIISSSKTNESLCENNMVILRLLSEGKNNKNNCNNNNNK